MPRDDGSPAGTQSQTSSHPEVPDRLCGYRGGSLRAGGGRGARIGAEEPAQLRAPSQPCMPRAGVPLMHGITCQVLKILTEKVDNMQEHMYNVRREKF